MNVQFVIIFLVFFVNCCLTADEHDHKEDIHEKPFDKVLEYLDVQNHTMSQAVLDTLTTKLFGRFNCSTISTPQSTPVSCPGVMCLNSQEIAMALSVANGSDIKEDQFEDLSTILLYHVLTLRNNCYTLVQINQNVSFFQAKLRNIFDQNNDSKIDINDIHVVLSSIQSLYKADDHDHEHSNGDHHDDHHDDKISVSKDDCVSPGMLFDNLKIDPDVKSHVEIDHLGDIASFLLYHLLKGAEISEGCRLLPRPSLLYHELAHDFLKVTNEHFTKTHFIRLYDAVLQSCSSSSGSGSPPADDGHNHARRKREADHVASDLKKFQEPRCYSADQLLAIHSVMNASAIPEQFVKDVCPSLLYLKVFDTCKSQSNNATSSSSDMSDAERYGYGSLAVFIICLCSLTGVLTLVFSMDSHYFMAIMSLFIGLSVGSLAGDAILHLLPTAFGLHDHAADDGHDHSQDTIVVEDYVWYSLVTMAGIYIFYLIETAMSVLGGKGDTQGGHGHSHGPADFSNIVSTKEFDSTSSQLEMVKEAEKTNNSDAANSDVINSITSKGRTSVAVMVIIGDSIHNFADGLAIGAAFSESGTLGIATSIAVFCHELPHELGDFAILVKNGRSVKAALCWNFLSSLTAFVGLYVGLSVSTDNTVRQWIFAATAGLFLYIALVDLIPEMISSTVTNTAHRKLYFFLNNVGILVGTLILVLLSIFEERIKI